MQRFAMHAAVLLIACSLTSNVCAKEGTWGPGVPYTTDWQKAIKEARATGKMLFIYSGWEQEGH